MDSHRRGYIRLYDDLSPQEEWCSHHAIPCSASLRGAKRKGKGGQKKRGQVRLWLMTSFTLIPSRCFQALRSSFPRNFTRSTQTILSRCIFPDKNSIKKYLEECGKTSHLCQAGQACVMPHGYYPRVLPVTPYHSAPHCHSGRQAADPAGGGRCPLWPSDCHDCPPRRCGPAP